MPEQQIDWSKPHEVSDLDIAFPVNVIGKYLPKESEIPKEFWSSKNKWSSYAESLFYGTSSRTNEDASLKEGLDPNLVRRHISAVLGSFEPKQEHKIAGAGYLLSLWFKSLEVSTEHD